MGWLLILAIGFGPAGAAQQSAALQKKPDWIGREAWFEPPVQYRVVTSQLWATPQEALREALQRACQAARDFAAQSDRRIGRDWVAPADLVHDHLVGDSFVEKAPWQFGPLDQADMYRAHLLLELSPQNRDRLVAAWWQQTLRRRLQYLGGGFLFVLVCLGTLFGYLRLDDALRGYYTGWLVAGAVAVVTVTGTLLYFWLV